MGILMVMSIACWWLECVHLRGESKHNEYMLQLLLLLLPLLHQIARGAFLFFTFCWLCLGLVHFLFSFLYCLS